MQAHAIQEAPSISSLIAADPQELADQMLEPTTMQALYEDTEAIISTNRTTDGLMALVSNAIQTMEDLWNDVRDEAPAAACQKGCSYCCHQSVMVTAAETVYIAQFLHNNLQESEVKRLRDHVGARARQADGLDSDQRGDQRIACAFLMDGVCSIYPVRPLQCRGGFSEDAEYCRSLLENREETQKKLANDEIEGKYLLLPKMLYDSAQVGMAGALSKDGLNSQPLDLNAALAIALSDPKVSEKYLRGWPVFESARLHRRKGKGHDTFATLPQQ